MVIHLDLAQSDFHCITAAAEQTEFRTRDCENTAGTGHLKFKAIQDFSRLFEKEIQDCFNNVIFIMSFLCTVN